MPESLLQPMLNTQWKAMFTKFPGNDTDILTHSIRQISLPRMVWSNHRSHQSGAGWSYEPGKLVFMNDFDGIVSDLLCQQMALQTKGSDNVFHITINTRSTDSALLSKYRSYWGCLITEIDYGSLDYETANPCLIMVTYSYDHVE